MPKVELTLSSFYDANFLIKKVVDFDDEDWQDMSPDQREAEVKDAGEQFLHDKVDWDYKILP